MRLLPSRMREWAGGLAGGLAGEEGVIGESALLLETRSAIEGAFQGVSGDDDAMIGKDRYGVIANRGCECAAALCIFDGTVVLIDEDHFLVEKASGLMEDLGQFA